VAYRGYQPGINLDPPIYGRNMLIEQHASVKTKVIKVLGTTIVWWILNLQGILHKICSILLSKAACVERHP
jgi:hypothetical protein